MIEKNNQKNKDSLDMVEEFMVLFNQPVHTVPTVPNKDRMILRAKLSLEELFERVQASGIEGSFATLLTDVLIKIFKDQPITEFLLKPLHIHIKEQTPTLDTNVVNLKDVLDAVLDERYVNDGAILEYGLEEMFRKHFSLLQESNLSKVCNSEEEAIKTCEFHKAQYGECYIKQQNEKWFVYESKTNKIMKSINYTTLEIKL